MTIAVKTLEDELARIGVFNAQDVMVIGDSLLLPYVVSLCARESSNVNCFCNQSPSELEPRVNIRIFRIDDSGQKQVSLLTCGYVIVLSCTVNILEELLFAVNPFCHIAIIGPIDGIAREFDFYDTVHYKNLELAFLSPLLCRVNGTAEKG